MAGVLDLRLRSERVEMDIDNSSKKLLPGMMAEINIPLASTYIVPTTALINTDEGLYVIKA